MLLGEPVSRYRVLGEKLIAFAIGTLLIGLLVSLGLMLGLAAAKLPADPGGSILAGLNLSLSAFVYGALGLVSTIHANGERGSGHRGQLYGVRFRVGRHRALLK